MTSTRNGSFSLAVHIKMQAEFTQLQSELYLKVHILAHTFLKIFVLFLCLKVSFSRSVCLMFFFLLALNTFTMAVYLWQGSSAMRQKESDCSNKTQGSPTAVTSPPPHPLNFLGSLGQHFVGFQLFHSFSVFDCLRVLHFHCCWYEV